MRRFCLSARLPKFEMTLDLAKAIRLFDKDAEILIREGKNINGDFVFRAEFDIRNAKVRYSDLELMFKNSVEKVGGALLN
jgi:hypothetical protein